MIRKTKSVQENDKPARKFWSPSVGAIKRFFVPLCLSVWLSISLEIVERSVLQWYLSWACGSGGCFEYFRKLKGFFVYPRYLIFRFTWRVFFCRFHCVCDSFGTCTTGIKINAPLHYQLLPAMSRSLSGTRHFPPFSSDTILRLDCVVVSDCLVLVGILAYNCLAHWWSVTVSRYKESSFGHGLKGVLMNPEDIVPCVITKEAFPEGKCVITKEAFPEGKCSSRAWIPLPESVYGDFTILRLRPSLCI